MTEERIAEIGRRANALVRAGFYSREEAQWLAAYVRTGAALLVEVELMITNAEEMMKQQREPA